MCNLVISVSVLSFNTLYMLVVLIISFPSSQKDAANTISHFPSYLHVKELNSLELFSMERKEKLRELEAVFELHGKCAKTRLKPCCISENYENLSISHSNETHLNL